MSNFNEEQFYTVPINDQGLNLYLRVGDNSVSFGYDEAVTFLMPVTRVIQKGNSIEVYLFDRKIFLIENGNVVKFVRHIPATELRNIGMMLRGNEDVYTDNEAHFSRSEIMMNSSVKTELHTHLIEILPSNKFLDFIERFNGKVKIDAEGFINFNEEKDT